MKLKFLAVLAIAGLAIVGCGSNKNDDGTTDSATVDTTLTSPSTTDTSMTDSAAMDTTMNKPADTPK